MNTFALELERVKEELDQALQENKQLREKLAAVIDACEDKGGQFRTWHQHLRETTRAGKELLNNMSKCIVVVEDIKKNLAGTECNGICYIDSMCNCEKKNRN